MSVLWSLVAGGALGVPGSLDLDLLQTLRWPLIGAGVLIFLVAQWLRGTSTTTARQLTGEMLIVVPAYFLYFLVRGFVEGREAQAFHTAIDIIELEQALGIFWEPMLQQHILHIDLVVTLANWTYIWGHWPVIVFVAIWLFMLHREEYSVYRNAFLISGAIGLIVFVSLPVAPPRFMDAWGFVDTVAERSEAYRILQPPAFVNQYAAMPSLHFGWNLLVGIAIYRHSSHVIGKIFGVALPVIMFASIVLTANHYIIDGLAGGSLALLGLFAALMLHQLSQRRVDTQRRSVAA